MIRFTAAVVVFFVAASQVARAEPEDGQFYLIKSLNSGKVISVAEDSDKAGAKIVQAAAKGAKGQGDESQHWKYVKVGDHYKFVNRKSGKVLEVPDGSKDDLLQIQQADDKGVKSKRQLWEVEKIRGKEFAIRSHVSGLVLDVLEADKKDGTAIIQHPLNAKGDRQNQLWDFIPAK